MDCEGTTQSASVTYSRSSGKQKTAEIIFHPVFPGWLLSCVRDCRPTKGWTPTETHERSQDGRRVKVFKQCRKGTHHTLRSQTSSAFGNIWTVEVLADATEPYPHHYRIKAVLAETMHWSGQLIRKFAYNQEEVNGCHRLLEWGYCVGLTSRNRLKIEIKDNWDWSQGDDPHGLSSFLSHLF